MVRGGDPDAAALACASTSCDNGGTCIDTAAGGFVCLCAEGFGGDTCGTTLDDCAASPCQNGGTCLDTVGDGYACSCAIGYSGTLCETNIDDCTDTPCLNAGTCVDGVDAFTCDCTTEFAGDICWEDLLCATGVTRTPIAGGGTSADLGYSFTVAEAVSVTELGAYNLVGTIIDPDGNIEVTGISDSILVGLYDESSLLISATITSSSALSNDYRYEAITPTMLSPGTTYSIIGGFSGSTRYFGHAVSNGVYDSRMTYTAMQSKGSPAATLPSAPIGNGSSWSDEYASVNLTLCNLPSSQ